MNKPVDIEAFVAKLREEYAESARDRLDRFEELLEALHSDGENMTEYRQDLQREVHSMKGSAGSYGFPAISAIAHRLEDYLETCEVLEKGNLRDVDTFIETIRAIAQTSVEPEGEDLAQLLNSLPSTAKPQRMTEHFSDQTVRNISVLAVMPRGLQRKIISTELVSCGFHVSLADSGVAAISALLAHPSDLVITAMELPDMSGSELAAALAVIKKTRTAKVALLTSYELGDAKLKNLPKGVSVIHKDGAFTENLAVCLTEFGIFR